jgi:5-hydroxyisourate hydrolase-like protein (transthyretin family)
MTLRVRSLWSVICLVLVVPGALPAQTGSPAQDVLGHIQRLDQEVGEHWRQARELAARGLLPDAAAERRRITGDTEALRARLRLLEIRAHGLPETDRDVLLDKLRLIGWVLEGLEKAAAGAKPSDHREVGPAAAALEIRSAAAALGANSCPDAPVIGYGTFSGTTVGATNDGTACGSSSFSPDVWFRFVAPETRTVSADTFGSGFDTVLSMHTGCPGTGFTQVCNDDASGLQSAISFSAFAGSTYWIRVSGFDGATGPFQLRVGPGGAMTGTVTRADNGLPVTSGRVRATSNEGGFFPFSVSDLLETDGTYTLAGLEAGSYHVQTFNLEDLQDEVWDDRPCTGRLLCDLESGDLVAVDSLGTTAGVDFALPTGGAITGTVVLKSTGEPMEGSTVRALTLTDEVVSSVRSGADGSYLLSGLAEGSYQVEVVGFSGTEFTGQVYDGVTCIHGCRPDEATPVPVTEGATTPGIDFQIERLGVLEGTVTDATTGFPIEGAFVQVYSADSNSRAGTANTDATGSFRMTGFDPGTYFLSAQKPGYLTEAYEEMPCPSFCTPSIGTPVPVDLDQEITGLDFTLEPFGSVSGTVTAAVGGGPVTDGHVSLYLGPGQFVTNAALDVDGSYRMVNVRAGTYFVLTGVGRGTTDFLDELYDDIPCYVDCDVSTGTSITVLAGTDTSGIDFALDLGGTLTGTVTDSLTGLALTSGTVGVYTPFGFFLESTPILGDGTFAVSGLLPGSYLLLASSPGYSGQLYESVPCFGGIHNFPYCDRLAGTPVEVGVAETVSGLDFALDPLGSISGRVTDAMSGAGVGGRVDAFDLGEGVIDSADLNPDGTYSLDALPAGSFFLRTWTEGYVDELYDDVVFHRQFCSFDCDFSGGTPIPVGVGGAVLSIDFQLDRLGEITGTVVDAGTGAPLSARVELFDEMGEQVGFAKFADASGDYLWPDLVPGTYFVLASTSTYLPEVYDDVLCQGCSPTKGTPVAVVSGAVTSGIDFALELFRAGLTGTVIAAETGQPAEGVGVQIWDSGGNPLMRVLTDDTGVWRAGLPAGTYFASTDSEGVFLDQVYQGVDCEAACDPLLGTPLTVANSFSIVREIDFFLARGSAIFSDGFESGDFSGWIRFVP